ncbi:MAG TPA: bifunctional oligoribonuclease/PAP phosphatase NrnA [Candidatus Onthocola gallistercoris]|uniref:Bifunctional oligoribonuclease/PAP phosphatase NrnA n=1 Tax=Candidatus Onthocola gallistercoris TaxID=2840876 RepID=A0A9D1HF45_9FIRM|nr:bifunctional oligoribonuclease/PAP phosphatase NrnA [Candidatus Onthocola gallistercoris]
MNNLLLDALKEARTIAITGHTRPDGDCVGSCMGLYHYIRDNYPEKKTDIFLEDFSDCYRMIQKSDQIKNPEQVDPSQVYDLFIVLDCSSKERMTEGMETCFEKAHWTLNIDHHISNTGYAQENHVAADASSASEVVFYLLRKEYIQKACAESLYMGMICDSGVFKYSQTSEKTMNAAGVLLSKGVDSRRWIDGVFYEKTYTQNRLMGRALLESRLTEDGTCISSCITREIFEEYGADRNDLEGIVEQMRLTKGVEVAILISQTDDDTYKFSLRSKERVDVNRIAGMFGGGGHKLAAGATVTGDWETTAETMIKAVKEQLDGNV